MDTQNQTPTENVQDAEVITDTSGQPANNDASVLLELESMIKSHLTGIDSRKNDLKNVREMIASALENDATYKEHDNQAKAAAKIKNATKSQILKQPQNAQLVEKMHGLATEVKEMSDALSEYLREYGRMSGSNEIEADDGTVREIVYVAKLIKKATK